MHGGNKPLPLTQRAHEILIVHGGNKPQPLIQRAHEILIAHGGNKPLLFILCTGIRCPLLLILRTYCDEIL